MWFHSIPGTHYCIINPFFILFRCCTVGGTVSPMLHYDAIKSTRQPKQSATHSCNHLQFEPHAFIFNESIHQIWKKNAFNHSLSQNTNTITEKQYYTRTNKINKLIKKTRTFKQNLYLQLSNIFHIVLTIRKTVHFRIKVAILLYTSSSFI